MTPIKQTILTAPGGDCFPACLASILILNLDDVPNYQGDDWQVQYHDWLKQFGMAMLTTAIPSEEDRANYPHIVLPGYTIVAVDSPRFPGKLHAVVALDGVIVWDPHPAATPDEYSTLVWREASYLVSLDAGLARIDRERPTSEQKP